MPATWEAVVDAFCHLILPASVLGCFTLAYIAA
jgi:ABC-type dipeptide/oligopeptide/nickel transport system permease component